MRAKNFKMFLVIFSLNLFVFSINGMDERPPKNIKASVSDWHTGLLIIKNKTSMPLLCTLLARTPCQEGFSYSKQFIIPRHSKITFPESEKEGVWLKKLDNYGNENIVPIWGAETVIVANKITEKEDNQIALKDPSGIILTLGKPGIFSIYETTDGKFTLVPREKAKPQTLAN